MKIKILMLSICDNFQPKCVYIVIFLGNMAALSKFHAAVRCVLPCDNFLIAANFRHASGLRQPIPIASQRGPEKTMNRLWAGRRGRHAAVYLPTPQSQRLNKNRPRAVSI